MAMSPDHHPRIFPHEKQHSLWCCVCKRSLVFILWIESLLNKVAHHLGSVRHLCLHESLTRLVSEKWIQAVVATKACFVIWICNLGINSLGRKTMNRSGVL
uniref:Uncharacterized protein n=1 Tax=Physcomitrium patens TaxID=3218 RepID=A0A2K1KD65_PHYPA|nr:hypothetical protein PHYPA_010910 [Physcomitrium patens]